MTARSHHAAPGPAKHLIGDDIHYSRDGEPAFVTCTCGVYVTGDTDLELDDRWRAHRRAVGAPSRVFSDVIRDSADTDPLRRPGRRPGRIMPPTPASRWSPY